jgi:hypothetical protein
MAKNYTPTPEELKPRASLWWPDELRVKEEAISIKTGTRGLSKVLVFLIWLVGMALLERSKVVTEYFLFNLE